MSALVSDVRGRSAGALQGAFSLMQENSEQRLNSGDAANTPCSRACNADEGLVPLLVLAEAQGRAGAHAALSAALAAAIDRQPTGLVQRLPLAHLSAAATLRVLVHVQDLDKATAVCSLFMAERSALCAASRCPPCSLLQRRDMITEHQLALHLVRDSTLPTLLTPPPTLLTLPAAPL